MAHQQTLFDDERPAKLARDSDPDTSHVAAADMRPKLGRLESRLLSAFRSWPMTAREAASSAARLFNHMHSEHVETDSYRKRYTVLLKSGRIESDGTKVCRITGKTVTAYTITDRKS